MERGNSLITQGHIWTGIVLLTTHIPPQIDYKYVLGSWESPEARECEWELGEHNRRAELNPAKHITICGTLCLT